jgi:cysteine synthase A
MCYYLLRNEGIWVGPSAALNVLGAVKLVCAIPPLRRSLTPGRRQARKLGPGKTIVTVLCDSGACVFSRCVWGALWTHPTGARYVHNAYNAEFLKAQDLTPRCQGTGIDFVL